MNINLLSQIPHSRNSQTSLQVQWTGTKQMIIKEEGARKKVALGGTAGRARVLREEMQRGYLG